MRPDTSYRKLVRRGCYLVLGVSALLVMILPINSVVFDIVPFLATMEQDHFGLRLFAAGITILFGLIYLVPTVVAYNRWHKQALPIFIVNTLLGWTFIVWFGTLVWSLWSNTTPSVSPAGEIAELSGSQEYKSSTFTKVSVVGLIILLGYIVYVSLSGKPD